VTDRARLERLLGGEDLSWLVARVRKRMERGESLDTNVTLPGATASQRAAVQRLLGRPPRPGHALTVSLAALDRLLRDSGACSAGLEAAIVTLSGEVVDRRAATAQLERSWQTGFEPLRAAVGQRPELQEWFAELSRSGLVRRLAGSPAQADPLLHDLAAVIGQLPASGEPLGRFAARVAGRAHALDDGEPLGTLTFGAARALSGLAPGSGAEWRREVWASVGILRDEVSTTVLTLGLPGTADGSTGRALGALREAGQPAVLTLRQVVRDQISTGARRIFVCENPVVVSAAADALGPDCAPLVCTSGQPSAAAMHLLRQLAAGGAQLVYHGDFDWGGIRIGNVVFDRLPARSWRFRAADYQATARSRTPYSHHLAGSPASANWDAALRPAMESTGTAIEEEHVLDELLADLAQ
jgi:uncharacterized protein (TIGR02679 family)